MAGSWSDTYCAPVISTSDDLSYPRPGFGVQHPEAKAFLALHRPLTEGEFEWPNGSVVTARCFAVTDALPSEVVQSVRVSREVREETGWHLDPISLLQVGWLHYEAGPHRGPGIPWPHPDIFHVLFTGRVASREAETWTDTEGYELSSRLVVASEVARTVTPGDVATPLVETLVALPFPI